MKTILIFCALLTVGSAGMAGETTFVIGARPWNFQPRSRESHLRLHMAGPDALDRSGGGLGSAGAAAPLPGYLINSNSYAIGNWIQVEMNLGDGSEGLIMVENDQTNDGDQQSVSDVLGELIETYQE